MREGDGVDTRSNEGRSAFGRRFDKIESYTNRQNEIYEVISRLPEQVTSQTIVTHLPTYSETIEDRRIQLFQKELRRKAVACLGRKEFGETVIRETLNELNISQSYSELLEGTDTERMLSDIMDSLLTCTHDLIQRHPELFIFRCDDYILSQFNRHAHDVSIRSLAEDKSGFICKYKMQKIENMLVSTVKDITNSLVATYIIAFRREIMNKSVISSINQKIDLEIVSDAHFHNENKEAEQFSKAVIYEKQNMMGNLISILRAHQDISKINKYSPKNDRLSDRECIILREGATHGFQYNETLNFGKKIQGDPVDYVSWRRGNRSWVYTVFEGIDYTNTDTYFNDMSRFTKRLMRAGDATSYVLGALENSEKTAHIWKDESEDDLGHQLYEYNFPGRKLGGASYYCFEPEVLIALTYVSQASDDRHSNNISVRAQEYLKIRNQYYGRPINTLCGFCNYIEKLWNDIAPISSGARSNVLSLEQFDADMKDAISEPRYIFTYIANLGYNPEEVRSIVFAAKRIRYLCRYRGKHESLHMSRRRAQNAIVSVMIALWKATISDHFIVWNRDEEDFIASSVVGGRGIYLSNFRPYFQSDANESSDESGISTGFTRTFFLDLGLTPFQRGRLIRRLTDIATYRLACVKDYGRIKALGHGLDEVHDRLGLLQRSSKSTLENRTATQDNKKTKITNSQLKERVGSLTQEVSSVQELLSELSEFNSLITGGITDRRGSTTGYLTRIRDRLRDIREERIYGFATLNEFVDRGIGRAVAEIDRTAQRYETLRSRGQQLLSQYSTEINMVSTRLSANNMTAIAGLLRRADLLVYAGGTYYISLLFIKLLDGPIRAMNDDAKPADALLSFAGHAALFGVIILSVLYFVNKLEKEEKDD